MGNSMEHVKAILDERLLATWRDRWARSEKGRATFEFIRDTRIVRHNPDFGFGLSLAFILTGHGSFNAFLHQRGLAVSSECSCSRGREDQAHVLVDCSLYEDLRDLGAMGIVRRGTAWDFGQVVENAWAFRRLSEYARAVFDRRRIRR